MMLSFVLYQILQFILQENFIPYSVNEVKFVNNSKPDPHHGSCFIKIPALIIITGTRAYSTDIKRSEKKSLNKFKADMQNSKRNLHITSRGELTNLPRLGRSYTFLAY